MRIGMLAGLACAHALLVCFDGSAMAQRTEAGMPKTQPPARQLIAIQCAEVLEKTDWFASEKDVAQSRHCGGPVVKSTDQPDQTGTLVGTGDVRVAVDTASLLAAAADASAAPDQVRLFLNGIDMGRNGTLIAREDAGNFSTLRFHVDAGKDSQKLWAMLYRTVGLTSRDGLSVGLGWDGGTASLAYTATQGNLRVAVTHAAMPWIALAVVVALLLVFVRRGAASDVFRDAPTPAWWRTAMVLRRQVRAEMRRGRDAHDNDGGATNWTSAALSVLAAQNAGFVADDPAACARAAQAANAALSGRLPDPRDESMTIAGLVLRQQDWMPVRATFSLTRVQLALWFSFAVCSGVFLWVIYGDLPAIDGSVLVLLGISVGTTGASFAVDQNFGGHPFEPSGGFLHDLVTGFADDKQQIHRLQAVIVNLMLLVVGIVHVAQNLTYPTFESTWLVFLGVSGGTMVLGKQYVEK